MTAFAQILALDAGGSKTAAALYDMAGGELAAVTVGACNLHQAPEAGIAEIGRAWRLLCGMAGLDADAAAASTCVSGGIAGVSDAEGRRRLGRSLQRFAGLRLSSDGYVILLGAFEGRPGAVLSIGTGVVGYRRYADCGTRQLGGWGFPAGDRGGGAWLGWRVVVDWLEARDGHAAAAPPPRLAAAVERLIGSDRETIVGRLRGMRPGDHATLARPLVDEAAAGDGYARTLLDEAAAHLLRLARALTPTADEPLMLAGGLAPAFASRLRAGLPQGCLADRMPSPLRGAWLVGAGHAPAEYPGPAVPKPA